MKSAILALFSSSIMLAVISCCCLGSILPQGGIENFLPGSTLEAPENAEELPGDANTPVPASSPTTLPPEPPAPPPPTQPKETPPQGGLEITDTVTYDIVDQIRLVNNGPGVASVDMKVALINTILPYQEVVSMEAGQDYIPLTDRDGNQYANILIDEFKPGAERNISIKYRVKVNGLRFSLGNCIGPLPDEYTQPEKYIESDSQAIINLSNKLSIGKATVCDQARAFYDYASDNMVYEGYNASDYGALKALEKMSGDCTEFSDLTSALSRAAGIPAVSIDGVACCTQNGYDEGQNKHNWLEAYFPGSGWVPLDPTWGRLANLRSQYFAAITPDHIIVTRGKSPQLLGGYHYYFYNYKWGAEKAEVASEETWSILEAASN